MTEQPDQLEDFEPLEHDAVEVQDDDTPIEEGPDA